MAQTPDELQSKYGQPGHGAYTVKPDARLTVTYGGDGQACRLILEPADQDKDISPATADRVLNDIAPVSARKGKERSMTTQSGCMEIFFQNYSNVTIVRNTDECKQAVQLLTIQWIRQACGNATE